MYSLETPSCLSSRSTCPDSTKGMLNTCIRYTENKGAILGIQFPAAQRLESHDELLHAGHPQPNVIGQRACPEELDVNGQGRLAIPCFHCCEQTSDNYCDRLIAILTSRQHQKLVSDGFGQRLAVQRIEQRADTTLKVIDKTLLLGLSKVNKIRFV